MLDLLYSEEKRNTTERIFDDLCFENIKQSVFNEQSELYLSFCNVLSHISTDTDIINERRLIFEDFCRYNNLVNDMLELCEKARERKINFRTSIYHKMEQTISLIEIFDQLRELLDNKTFRSKTLSTYHITPCNELISEIKKANRITQTEFLKLNVNFSSGFKLKKAVYVNSEPLNINPVKKIRKKTHPPDNNRISFRGLSMIQYTADEIREAATINLYSIISQINVSILGFFKNLKRSLLFYLAALKLKEYLDKNNLPYCFPTLTRDKSFGISATGLYDLSLAAYMGEDKKQIVSNDFNCNDGRFIIVTGMNNGGKTTFLRSIGIAQLLAQSGLFVPAKDYKCCCFSGILSHFPTEEDSELDFGKLAEELTRLRNDFSLVVHGGLALFNESFSTTTAHEAIEIAIEVLRALSQTESTVIFVTHLYELATGLDTLNEQLSNPTRAVNMITEYKDSSIRTYKIIRGEPIKEIHAIDMFVHNKTVKFFERNNNSNYV